MYAVAIPVRSHTRRSLGTAADFDLLLPSLRGSAGIGRKALAPAYI
jgi:hypothetical protein